MARSCPIRKNRTICSHCEIPGHLAKVCFAALQGKPKAASREKAQSLRAIMGPTDENEDQELWVNRLALNVLHKMGSFTFNRFPDTGSAATLIAAYLAKEKNISPTKPSFTKYINVSGEPVPTLGTAPVQLSTSHRVAITNAVVTPAISNKIKWVAGKENVMADALSRAPAKSTDDSTSLPINACVLAPTSTLAEIIDCARTDVAYKQIVDAFKQCRELSSLPGDHPARRLKQVWGRISLSNKFFLNLFSGATDGQSFGRRNFLV